MDSKLLEILNEELMESKQLTRLAQQRLDLQREELNKHSAMLDKHSAMLDKHSAMLDKHSAMFDKHASRFDQQQEGLKLIFQQIQKLDEKLDRDLARLRKDN